MAIFKVVNNRAGHRRAMKNCLEYVRNEKKTEEDLCTVTGEYIEDRKDASSVFKDFSRIKSFFHKEAGRQYYHSVLSWHRDEKITPEQALEIGTEFAEKFFDGFQTLVAVHIDRDHIHAHMVTNSISYVDGKHFHMSKDDLKRGKEICNELCKAQGLSVPEKGKHHDSVPLEEGEIIAWSKDRYVSLTQKSSYVSQCAIAVEEARSGTRSKEMFVKKMKDKGWTTVWEETRKHITFICDEDGKKVRDSNLDKTFNIKIDKEILTDEFIQNERSAGRTATAKGRK